MQRSTLNTQRSTLKAEESTPDFRRGRYEKSDKFDLEDRLLHYAVKAVRLVEKVSRTRTGNHIAAQFLRSGTAVLPNHGEAQAAESPADFVHKMRICLKELRESRRWPRLIQAVPLIRESPEADFLLDETDQLIRIFSASIRTATNNMNRSKIPTKPDH